MKKTNGTPPKGLHIDIYTNPAYRKCANGGLTETHDQALVVGEGIPEIFPADGLPVLVLKPNRIPGGAHLEPLVDDPENHWFMAGGSFGHTSDSRLGDAIKAMTGVRFYGALPIHDREEK